MKRTMSLLLAALSPLTSCCAPREARLAADDLVQDVIAVSKKREQAYVDALEATCRRYLEGVAARNEHFWSERRAVAKQEVLELTIAKRSELTAYVRTEMDAALGPKVQQLSKALEDAKNRFRAGNGGEDQKNELALQLASVLAVSQKSVFDLDQQIDRALADALSDAKAMVVEKFGSPPALPDPAAKARELVAEVEADRAKHAGDLDDAATKLNRFIFADSALALVFKGALGDSLGSKLFGKLESEANSQLETLRKKADAALDRVRGKYEAKVGEAFNKVSKQGGK